MSDAGVDVKGVARVVRRVAREARMDLYSEDGLDILRTGLLIDEPEGIVFRVRQAGTNAPWREILILLADLRQPLESVERTVRAALEA